MVGMTIDQEDITVEWGEPGVSTKREPYINDDGWLVPWDEETGQWVRDRRADDE